MNNKVKECTVCFTVDITAVYKNVNPEILIEQYPPAIAEIIKHKCGFDKVDIKKSKVFINGE